MSLLVLCYEFGIFLCNVMSRLVCAHARGGREKIILETELNSMDKN